MSDELFDEHLRISDILSLARVNRLTSKNAAYLKLAMHKEFSLATLDEDLKKAKKAASKPGIVLL